MEEEVQPSLATYIGPKGAYWKRLCLVFEGLGYASPRPDTPDGNGGYLGNIAGQYIADFSQQEIRQIALYARSHTVADIETGKSQGWIDREAVFGERSLP